MTDRQPGRDPLGREDGRALPAAQAAAEAKRLEARRRFLLGGTSAISVLVTAKRGSAATWTECAVQIGGPDTPLTQWVPIFRNAFGSFAIGCDPIRSMQSTQASEPPL